MAEWPPEILPLEGERRPFSSWTDVEIECFAKVSEEFPEANGRLYRLLRAARGQQVDCPARFVMVEAHVDVSSTASCPHIRSTLLKCGFEPDHFRTLNPPDYDECYTLRFEVPFGDTARLALVRSRAESALSDAQRVIQDTTGVFAYTELESYSEKMVSRRDFEPPRAERVEDFPLPSGAFVPDFSGVYKSADLHVKLPFHWSRHGHQADCGSWESMLRIRQRFIAAGFYQIQSLSGNAIFTVQTADVRDAKATFQELTEWLELGHTGVTTINFEQIEGFWRKEEIIGGERFVSPIPMVMRRT